jgi:hypothetical protein
MHCYDLKSLGVLAQQFEILQIGLDGNDPHRWDIGSEVNRRCTYICSSIDNQRMSACSGSLMSELEEFGKSRETSQIILLFDEYAPEDFFVRRFGPKMKVAGY